mmetsp:Transcript_9014/g.19472  ORF Transcript_9014/g.19472 Transcript_9014/m.19472 type:complete len:98 (+) Transcript_9014:612-905(+)
MLKAENEINIASVTISNPSDEHRSALFPVAGQSVVLFYHLSFSGRLAGSSSELIYFIANKNEIPIVAPLKCNQHKVAKKTFNLGDCRPPIVLLYLLQ